MLAAMAVPGTLARIDESRGRAAVRYLTGRAAQARMQAAMGGRAIAIRFERAEHGVEISVYQDGDRDGVRSAEIRSGVDVRIDGPVPWLEQFPGVTLAAPDGDDTIRLGEGELLTFTPDGTATSGSIYLRSREDDYYAVRVLGATGRTRVQRYDPPRREWVDGF